MRIEPWGEPNDTPPNPSTGHRHVIGHWGRGSSCSFSWGATTSITIRADAEVAGGVVREEKEGGLETKGKDKGVLSFLSAT